MLYRSRAHRGESPRQYGAERQRLYRSGAHREGRAHDNTEREGIGHTDQEPTEGEGTATIWRGKPEECSREECTRGVQSTGVPEGRS